MLEKTDEGWYSYPVLIKETDLDFVGHVNNASYLTLFEEARWDLITKRGYGLKKIQETGIGPVILEINLRFIKELRNRDEIAIETKFLAYEKKIGLMSQRMVRKGDVCATIDLKIGLFDMKERKLILPTADWIEAVS